MRHPLMMAMALQALIGAGGLDVRLGAPSTFRAQTPTLAKASRKRKFKGSKAAKRASRKPHP